MIARRFTSKKSVVNNNVLHFTSTFCTVSTTTNSVVRTRGQNGSMSCDAPPSLSVMHHLPSPWCYCGPCTCVCLLGGPHTSTRRSPYSDCATASLYSSPAPCSTDFSLMNMQMQIMTSEPACGPKQAPTCSRSRAFMCLRWFVCVRARIHAQAHIPAQARNRTDTSIVHQ